jgi:hypothetical protein
LFTSNLQLLLLIVESIVGWLPRNNRGASYLLLSSACSRCFSSEIAVSLLLALSFLLALLALSPFFFLRFCRLDIVRSKLLGTCPVVSPCSFSLVLLFLLLHRRFLFRLLIFFLGFPATSDFRLLSLILFRVRYSPFSFSSACALSFRDRVAFFSFSLSLFRFIYYADRNYLWRHYIPPCLQWYQLLVAPLLKIPLTLS